MKQTIQQTAVQRAVQPVARSIPSGLEQFDMAAGEEEPAIQEQVDERAARYERYKEQQAKKRARLVSISEEELATPGQIDDMMASSSAAASSSGYDAGSSTAIVPVSARTQAFEEQIQGNLRGSRWEGPEPPWGRGRIKEPIRWTWAGQHRRSDSAASTESAASAASAASTATTVAIPPQIQQQMDIDTLVHISKQLRVLLNQRNTDDDAQLAMEIMTNV